MAGLSRGSSAESSLKRTKRKAPPPPTSPSVVVQETDPVDENLQGLSLFTFVSIYLCLQSNVSLVTHTEGCSVYFSHALHFTAALEVKYYSLCGVFDMYFDLKHKYNILYVFSTIAA